jgi:hypothetical protein
MASAGDVPIGEPDEQIVGITRRQALKRGAIFGGALAWATPVVQIIGMKPAFAQVTSPVGDRVVTARTGNTAHCFIVTHEVFDCFEAECVGEANQLSCLNSCQEKRGIGQLEKIVCPDQLK